MATKLKRMTKRGSLLLLFQFLMVSPLILSPLLGLGQAKMAAKEYSVILFKKNMMIPMRDGVKLATDVYRPTINGKLVEGKLPVLLQRTPYGKFKAEEGKVT
jgi:predicted acyl esterase